MVVALSPVIVSEAVTHPDRDAVSDRCAESDTVNESERLAVTDSEPVSAIDAVMLGEFDCSVDGDLDTLSTSDMEGEEERLRDTEGVSVLVSETTSVAVRSVGVSDLVWDDTREWLRGNIDSVNVDVNVMRERDCCELKDSVIVSDAVRAPLIDFVADMDSVL